MLSTATALGHFGHKSYAAKHPRIVVFATAQSRCLLYRGFTVSSIEYVPLPEGSRIFEGNSSRNFASTVRFTVPIRYRIVATRVNGAHVPNTAENLCRPILYRTKTRSQRKPWEARRT